MPVPQIGQIKMKEDFPQHLYHPKFNHSRRVDTAEQKAEALHEGWSVGYQHKDYPKAMYSALGDYKEVESKDEEDELRALGWEGDPAMFTDIKIIHAKRVETEKQARELKDKEAMLLKEREGSRA